MDAQEFREFGRAAVDFVADYLENIRERDVLPSVEPGYLEKLLPTEAPEQPENWKAIMEDMNRAILPGITHWQSPNFHAYYPTATSYPSIVGDMITAGFGVIGFSWICSPVCTELEVITMDWLAKMMGVPEIFHHKHPGNGGGVLQGSASESILVAVLAAREHNLKRLQLLHPELTESEIRGRIVGYSSDQSNSAIEKSGLLGAVPIRLLKSDEKGCLTGQTLEAAVQADLKAGNFPVICIATLGTTGTCAFDKITELGPICNANNIWLHVDAAYAGASFCCPEYQHLLKGIELVDSFNFNLHKWMFVNFDCAVMWLKNSDHVADSFNVNRIYLQHKFEGKTKIPDFRHWQIALGRKFRSLKVWIVLRTMGVEKIRAGIRKQIGLATYFENLLTKESRFEIVTNAAMGLLSFRVKGDDEQTKQLLEAITERKQIYMIPATVAQKYVIRFAICGMDPQEKDMDFAMNEINLVARELFDAKVVNAVKVAAEEVTVDNLKDSHKIMSDLSISRKETEKIK